ncbi:MAG: hypothetical protein RhofKO_01530 [Rhodothermales bacterium]
MNSKTCVAMMSGTMNVGRKLMGNAVMAAMCGAFRYPKQLPIVADGASTSSAEEGEEVGAE